jgi:hypothetical protein
MADIASIGISVGTTIVLQSIYLALIKFPRILNLQTDAFVAESRLFTAGMEEGNFAMGMAGEALNLCSKAGELVLSSVCAVVDLTEIKRNLAIARSKLEGLDSCREPEVAHIRVIRNGVDRTLALANVSPVTKEYVALEMLSVTWAGQMSLKITANRVNEARTKLADGIEVRASDLNIALLEFWGASIIAYIGLLTVILVTLRWSVKASHLASWEGWVLAILGFFFCNWGINRLRRMGNSAESIVKSSKTQIDFTRKNLVKLN